MLYFAYIWLYFCKLISNKRKFIIFALNLSNQSLFVISFYFVKNAVKMVKYFWQFYNSLQVIKFFLINYQKKWWNRLTCVMNIRTQKHCLWSFQRQMANKKNSYKNGCLWKWGKYLKWCIVIMKHKRMVINKLRRSKKMKKKFWNSYIIYKQSWRI